MKRATFHFVSFSGPAYGSYFDIMPLNVRQREYDTRQICKEGRQKEYVTVYVSKKPSHTLRKVGTEHDIRPKPRTSRSCCAYIISIRTSDCCFVLILYHNES